jgi:type IV secretion system protein VirB10
MTGEDAGQAFEIRAATPSPARISRKAVMLALAAIAALLLFALFYGFHRSGPDDAGIPNREIPIQRPPDALTGIPADYSKLPPPPQPAPPPPAPAPAADAKPSGPTPLGPQAPGATPRPAPVDPEQQKAQQELDAARRSGLFIKTASTSPLKPAGAAAKTEPAPADDARGPAQGLLASGAREPAQDPNLQGRKESFLGVTAASDVYVKKPYLDPVSPYEIKAGTIIPAALVTALNSDLPGDVFAAVTENVYDTASGRHLLIPQGAKLIGRYDSFVAFGQSRALVRWDRLIMPDGRSIQFGPMSGADQTGAAGLTDEVDYHLAQAGIGIALSTAISLLGNLAIGRNEGGERQSLLEEGIGDAGDTVSQQAARVGSSITERFLNIQPTIRVRAGWPLRVLVNRDIILAPHAAGTAAGQVRN